MKKFVWPLLIIFFLLGGLAAILIGQVVLPPEPRTESVEAISEKWASSGHADRDSRSFTNWDENDPPEVPATCAKCHSAFGYLSYLGEDGSEPLVVDANVPIGSVVSCYVCHNPSAHEKDFAIFPSGAEIVDMGYNATCAECHQGRQSGVSVSNVIAELPVDEVNEELQFINVHYNPAAGTQYGTEVNMGYEYPGKEYVGFYEHVSSYQQCTDCHDAHSLVVTASDCAACHPMVSEIGNFKDVRMADTPDFDGDGNTTEGIYYELMNIHGMLYEAILTYADEVIGEPIVYAKQFPYWYNDLNRNGIADEDEVNFGNRYATWTPRLVRATYNYQIINLDPGGYMHNARYLIQLMIDTMEDLAEVVPVEMAHLTRPE